MIAEVQDEQGNWQKVGKVFPNPYYREGVENKTYEDEPGYESNPTHNSEPYGERNYDLFAMLADVRNGRGFAGVKTGDGFNPIADPKGIPEDASDEAKDFMDSYGGDGHSHSYFTLAELKSYDWDQISIKQGVIPLGQYNALKGTGKGPESWCGMIGGPDILVSEPEEITAATTHVFYRWAIKYRDHAENFLSKTIPALESLGEPEKVRILFFFDN